MPIWIYGAPAATVNDGRLALINAVILTVPTHHVTFVRHVAPSGVPLLISVTGSRIQTSGSRNCSEHKRQFDNTDLHMLAIVLIYCCLFFGVGTAGGGRTPA
jgi:hypothetical protein